MSDFTQENPEVPATPFSEKLKGLTGFFGIRLGEQPEYLVLRSEGDKEIRKYHPMTLASIVVPVGGNLEIALDGAHRALCGYVYGQNDLALHLGMTTPVLQEYHYAGGDLEGLHRPQRAGALTLSFVLPISYGLENAPAPLDTRIMLHRRPSHRAACIGYPGFNDEEKMWQHENELRRWLKGFSSYKPLDEVQIAQYDGPATPAFLRKNELLIEVRPSRNH